MSDAPIGKGNQSFKPGQGPGQGPGGPGHGPGGGRPGGPMGGLLMIVEKPKDLKGSLRRIFSYLKPRMFQVIMVVILTILGTAFGVISPKVLGNATTKIFEGVEDKLKGISDAGVDFKYLSVLVTFLVLIYLGSTLFNYLQQVLMAKISQKTVFDIREDINKKLSKLPLRFYDSRTHGEIMSRVTNDVDNISVTIQQTLTQMISAIVTLLGTFVMMLVISPLLTLIVVLTLPLSLFLTTVIAKKSQKYFKDQQTWLGELNGHVEEMYTGHKIVKAFGNEEVSIREFDDINDKYFEASWKAQFISGIIMPMMNFINNFGYVLVCVVGGILVTRNAMEIGDIQAFIQYTRQFSQPIVMLASVTNIIQSGIASAERVFELLDQPEELPDSEDSVEGSAPEGVVRISNVDFGYKENNPIIENLNMDVKSGQTIAIVGPTGAGKTTLVNLLMRFYELWDGSITIDGRNITDMKRGSLRRIFGMVLQDTWLFNGTIRDNIAYGREGATEEEIIRAAKAAHADHFIRTLPDGYNTLLNEDASNISQGQKQLLTIARAILSDPAILILDEATSSVDTRTEILIQKAMTSMMKGRTSFVIAHRLSTIREADIILVMNNGSIIETGSHKELLEQKGFYADLYNSQFTGANLEELAV